jgi:hypothetical protein
MLRLPPETTFPDGDGEDNGSSWYENLDGDGYGHQWMFGINGGKLYLKQTKRGVDVLYYGDAKRLRVSAPNFDRMMNVMRGLRSVLAGRAMPFDGYAVLETDRPNLHFIASLAPGRYAIDTPEDGSQQLYWLDHIGTAHKPKPLLEPEVRHLTPPPPKPQRRDLVLLPPTPEVPNHSEDNKLRYGIAVYPGRRKLIAPAAVAQRRNLAAPTVRTMRRALPSL